MKKTNKQILFERMGLSSPKFEIKKESSEENFGEGNKFNVQELVPSLQKVYYQTGYFPVQNPDGSIKFIQNDEEFDAFLDKVQQSFSNIELPF